MKKRRFWISALVSAVLLYLALRRIRPADVLQALQGIRYEYLLLAGLVRIGLACVRALRWQVLLTPATGRVRLSPLLQAWLIGFFGNYTLPSQSGELLKLYVLGRNEALSRSAILGTILLEKLLDVLTLLLFLVTLLFLFPLPVWMSRLGWMAGLLWLVGLFVLLALANHRAQAVHRLDLLLQRLLPRFADWGVARFDGFVGGLSALRLGHGVVPAALLSLLVWTGQVLPFTLVGMAMGLKMPFQTYLLLLTIFNLASLVPALPGRLGTLEFVFASILPLFQADQSVAFSYALLFRLTHLLPLALGWFFFSSSQGVQQIGESVNRRTRISQ
ncbi:MAG TPA: flippase-like domain-containing protein [Anaerolineae bacterium]|nr:flippase-like domain-containing protein [Anaerolineae bacterium]